ncbi:MAG: DUF4112 domain-containing protein [Bacteroidales bacterium]|nr:DUF4112 domain-containing protein [Bacteroidales bacterium]
MDINNNIEQTQTQEDKSSISHLNSIRKWMDDYYLDPILGIVAPGFGDWITPILSVPYIIVSIVKLKSISLTLAIIYNILIDCVLGTIPIAGDIADFLHKSFKKNCVLVEGFMNKDPKVINEVKRKSVYFGFMIILLVVVLGFMIYWTTKLWSWIFGLFN